jgi:hypothetical protein
MSINIGGIDLAQSALDSEFRIIVLEKVVEKLLTKIGGTTALSPAELESLRADAFRELQKKYPAAGLTRKH